MVEEGTKKFEGVRWSINYFRIIAMRIPHSIGKIERFLRDSCMKIIKRCLHSTPNDSEFWLLCSLFSEYTDRMETCQGIALFIYLNIE
jgi:hypothetical protein